jgi:hypothetical protein
MGNSILNSFTAYLLITVIFSAWGLQGDQADGENTLYLLAYPDSILSWSAQKIDSDLQKKEVFQSSPHLSLRNRIVRIPLLKFRFISRDYHPVAITQMVRMRSSAQSFSHLGQTDFYRLPVSLGSETRKIPTPENTDEITPLLYLA